MSVEKTLSAVETLQDTLEDHFQIIKMMKKPSGHLTPFGWAFVEAACAKGTTHAKVAAMIGINRSAVSAHMKKIERGEIAPLLG